MKIWLQTRGITSDYAFLGEAPSERWWRKEAYQSVTSFEQPTLILERRPQGQWRCFISAIPSTRRDRVNTPIRYSLALQGSVADQENLFKLLGHLLEAFRTNPVATNSPLTHLLDDVVGDKADEWLNGNATQVQDSVDTLERKIAQLQNLPLKNDLRHQVQKLLEGDPEAVQLIAMFNFIGSEESLSVKDLQSRWNFSQGNILLLGSPIAGGNIDNLFLVKAPVIRIPVPHVTVGRKQSTRRNLVLGVLVLAIILILLAVFIVEGSQSDSVIPEHSSTDIVDNR